jgi:ubiquinone/menaquinone biosynthesis C-methylase UbiE
MTEIDPKKFREFEHAGWQAIPSEYHRAFGSLTMQAIEPLLDAVGAGKRTKLLDLASGPGYVAAAAAKRGATVVGVDFSAAMVAEAKRLYPSIEFREGDAEELPFGEGLFDAVVMNFGLLHLGRPEQALAEARRVLRSGGGVAFTVWANPEDAVGFKIVLRAIEAHGELNVRLPPGPPFFRFSDPAEAVRSLLATGFESPKVIQVPQVWRLPAGDGVFDAMRESTVRTAGLLRAQEPQALEKIRNYIRKETTRYTKRDIVEIPMPAILASAAKP